MLFKALSAAVFGIDAYVVEVEVDVSAGNGVFLTVGLPDTAVKESKERIKSAIKNCGLDYPFQNITVNLAPADIRKEGSAFDLPMAIGILGTNGTFLRKDLSDYIFLGELSLDGGLRPIKGALSIAVATCQKGIRNLVLPSENAREAAVVSGITVYGMKNLVQVIDPVNQTSDFEPVR
jgi:magnesium chelatase family protein